MTKRTVLSFAAVVLSAFLSTTSQAQITLNGAGATFPNPIYTKWFSEYQKVDPSVQFNYQAIGSGGGQKQILAQTVDFGASDGPMKDADLGKAPGKILHLPTVAGAVVVSYNLPGSPALKFDGETLAAIYLGTITKWNDPAIAKLNPGVTLPDLAVVSVHRADGSGTNYIFTDYLSSVSPAFKEKVGVSTAVEWPGGVGAKGNDGVAGQIKQTSGAIGYVELIYALQNKMSFADLKNKDGAFVKASLDSVTAALATATIPDDFRFSMVNAPGKTSYPIAGATWLLVYADQKDAAKGGKLVNFLNWYLTKGADSAKALDYAPLPDSVRDRVIKLVADIKVAK
jgi:phosphate transport system substrate-binding protein